MEVRHIQRGCRRSGGYEAKGSCAAGTRGMTGAALAKPWYTRTVGWCVWGKHIEEVYARKRCHHLALRITVSNPADRGRERSAVHCFGSGWSARRMCFGDRAGLTANDCGVAAETEANELLTRIGALSADGSQLAFEIEHLGAIQMRDKALQTPAMRQSAKLWKAACGVQPVCWSG